MKTREYLIVLLLLLLLAALFTYPLVFRMHNSAVSAYGDPLLNTWILAWDHHALIHSPLSLFQANIIYPSQDVLGFSEHLFTLEVFAFPVISLTGNPLLGYNLLLFLGLIFSGFAMYLLIRYLTGSRYAAFVGAVFFAFCPYKIAKLGHLQICFTVFMPLLLLYLHKFLDSGKRKHLVLFGIFFLAQALASWYLVIFSAVAATLLVICRMAAEWRNFPWRKLGQLALAAAAVFLIVLPFALPYLRLHQNIPEFSRPKHEIAIFSANIGSYFKALPESLFYGSGPWILKTLPLGSEKVLFPGLVVSALALIGLVTGWRRKRRRPAEDFEREDTDGEAASTAMEQEAEAAAGPTVDKVAPRPPNTGAAAWADKIFYILLGLTGFLFSFGPYGSSGDYHLPSLIFYKLGLFSFIRVPARFALLLFLALAVLAGYGVAWLESRVKEKTKSWPRGRWVWPFLGGVLVILMVLDVTVWGVSISRVPVGDEVPQVYSWLKEQPGQVMVDAPFEKTAPEMLNDPELLLYPANEAAYFARESLSVYYSTFHWKKILNGYSGYIPYHYCKTVVEMQDFPSARSVDLLRGVGVDYVVWHWDWVDPADVETTRAKMNGWPGLVNLGDFGQETVYQVQDAGQRAEQSSLVCRLAAPSNVYAGETTSVGLLVTNSSTLPFVCMDDYPATAHVTWQPLAGGPSVSNTVISPYLFFLTASESRGVVLPNRVPDEPGEYEISVSYEGGSLGGCVTNPVHVTVSPPDAGASYTYTAAGLEWAPAGETILQGAPGQLLPWTVRVTDGGAGNLAVRAIDGKSAVRVGTRWVDENGRSVEGQQCDLVCDLSPGQSMEIPILLALPAAEGRYTVQLQLLTVGGAGFGDVLTGTVQVANPAPSS